jgi:hypothetical protein
VISYSLVCCGILTSFKRNLFSKKDNRLVEIRSLLSDDQKVLRLLNRREDQRAFVYKAIDTLKRRWVAERRQSHY